MHKQMGEQTTMAVNAGIRIKTIFLLLSLEGAQWLSGRVLGSRPKGRGLEPHRCHCIVSLSKTH